MNPEYRFLSEELKGRNIRPSQQRLKILEYFHASGAHLTADEIYHALKGGMPSLSKATVYNTLRSFVREKLVEEVSIESHEERFGLCAKPHGHFKCLRCGAIYDFAIDIGKAPVGGLEEFQIDNRDVYFKGVCPKCLPK